MAAVSSSLILGLESSCDETAAALVRGDRTVLAHRLAGQEAAHRPYGGVVPEIAARAHVEMLVPLAEGALADAGVTLGDVDAIAATAGLPQRALYSASKGAVQSLTFAMAADHVAEGIRVNCVNPGTVDTPWVRRLLDSAPDPDAEIAALRARQPTGQLVAAQEVAESIAYLASPSAASITGTALAVDGGMSGLRLPPRSPG